MVWKEETLFVTGTFRTSLPGSDDLVREMFRSGVLRWCLVGLRLSDEAVSCGQCDCCGGYLGWISEDWEMVLLLVDNGSHLILVHDILLYFIRCLSVWLFAE